MELIQRAIAGILLTPQFVLYLEVDIINEAIYEMLIQQNYQTQTDVRKLTITAGIGGETSFDRKNLGYLYPLTFQEKEKFW